MRAINDFSEAVTAYMLARKESIYSNNEVASKFKDLSQIIISLLNHQNLNAEEIAKITNSNIDDVMNSIDFIVDYSYKQGFVDGMSFKQITKGMK